MSALSKQVGGEHYKSMPIQPAEFIHRNGVGWLEGVVIEYVCRHRRKNGEADIDKAIHTLELLKELEYGGSPERDEAHRDRELLRSIRELERA